MGVVLVYDVTKRESFNSITHWLADAKQRVHQNASYILIGNKSLLLSFSLNYKIFDKK